MEIKQIKNILIVSFGFLLLFTAYGGLQNLQSSLNPEKGLGVASLSVVYGCLIGSSLFLSPIIIKKIGCKWTIVASMCCYVTYSIGNFKPNWYSLIITSAILGIGGGPLWAAKCTYLTASGIKYAVKTGKEKIDVVNHYFGIFFLIYQSSGVWGNLISSLVLENPVKEADVNRSLFLCGAKSCPVSSKSLDNSTGTTQSVSDNLRYTLMGIYTGCGVLAVILVTVLLDQIDLSEEEKNEEEVEISIWKSLLATIRQLKDVRQCMLIPLTTFSGFQQGFISSEYTKAYVTCTLGIHFVGYVMICFGATNSICSLLFGKLSQYTGRITLFMLAAATSASCVIALLLWNPHPNQLAVFFIFPALWSMSDAICQTLLNAFYGVLFADRKEAAFANYRLWESLGYVITFAYTAATSASCVIALLLWNPHPNQLAVFFIFPALWSMSDAICQTLLNAFYGVLFADRKEAAFANYRLWESLGYVITFAYSNFLCVNVKLYIVLSVMILGMTLYLVVEYTEYKKSSTIYSRRSTKE